MRWLRSKTIPKYDSLGLPRDSFPLGKGARAGTIAPLKDRTAEKMASERRSVAKGDKAWGVYDENAIHFSRWFDRKLFQGHDLLTYLRRRFPQGMVGVELGGPGGRLFDSINATVVPVTRSLGVTLVKHPNSVNPPFHSIVEGDLNEHAAYEGVVRELRGARADLIISRMIGGRQYLRKDPYFFAQEIAYLYEHALSTKGIFVLSLPGFFAPFLPEWKKLLNAYNIRCEFVEVSGGYSIIMERNENSPAQLPLLGIEELRRVHKTMRVWDGVTEERQTDVFQDEMTFIRRAAGRVLSSLDMFRRGNRN